MHLSVADRRQRFNAEEERALEARRIQVGDTPRHEIVEVAKENIEAQEKRRNCGEELRPGNRHEEVIKILEHGRLQALRQDLALAELEPSDANGSACLACLAVQVLLVSTSCCRHIIGPIASPSASSRGR